MATEASEFSPLLAKQLEEIVTKKNEEKEPLPQSATVFSTDDSYTEPGFSEAHQIMDRRTYLGYATGKILRRAGLILATPAMGELVFRSQRNDLTSEVATRDIVALAAGGTSLLKGDSLIRKALNKTKLRKP